MELLIPAVRMSMLRAHDQDAIHACVGHQCDQDLAEAYAPVVPTQTELLESCTNLIEHGWQGTMDR